jgi:hypothetical protein
LEQLKHPEMCAGKVKESRGELRQRWESFLESGPRL